MCALRNEKGLALISTLMLLVLGFGVVAMLLRLVTAETKLARLEQSYTTALDTGKAGADMLIFMVQNGISSPPNPGIGTGTSPLGGQCLNIKMTNATSGWYTAAWTAAGCPTLASGQATSADPAIAPDVTMTLAAYTVSIKIVDTSVRTGTFLDDGSTCDYGCYYYTVNVRSVAPSTNERADITFVYRFDM